MKSFSVFYMILLVGSACTDKKPFTPFFQKENSVEYNKTMDLVSREILEFPLDSNLRFTTYSVEVSPIEGREYLSFLDADFMTLLIYDSYVEKQAKQLNFRILFLSLPFSS